MPCKNRPENAPTRGEEDAVDEMLANRYLRSRRYGDALPFLEEVVRLHPDRDPARHKLILCYLLTGHVPESVSLVAEFVEQHPDDLHAAADALDAIPANQVRDSLKRRKRVLPEGIFHAAMAVTLLYLDPDLTHTLAELDAAAQNDDALPGVRHLRDVVRARLDTTEA